MGNPNLIKMDGNFIAVTIIGPQTLETVEMTIKSVNTRIQSQRRKGRKALILLDVTPLASHDAAARRQAKHFFRLNYDRMAVYGARSSLYNLIQFLAGPKFITKIRFFRTRKKAAQWLKSDEPPEPSKTNPFIKSRFFLLLAVSILGLALTSAAALKINQQNMRQAAIRANTVTQDSAESIQEKIGFYFSTIYGFKGLFEASDHVTQRNFRDYFLALSLDKRLPGFNAITYIREVPTAYQEEVVSQIRSDYSIENSPLQYFEITNRNSGDILYPVVYIEPESDNPTSHGFDLGSLPDRLSAFKTAEQKHTLATTDTFNLIAGGKPTSEKGFLMTIYVDGGFDTCKIGFINAVFAYNKFFAGIPELSRGSFQISDSSGKKIYPSQTVRSGGRLLSESNIEVANKEWTLKLYGTKMYGLSTLERISPLIAFLFGLVATALVTFAFYNLLRSRQAAYELADQITEDLRVAEHQHDLLIDNVRNYAIFMLDPQGRITSWNSGAQLINGYKASEIIGKKISILYPKEQKANASKILKAAAEKGSLETVGWRLRKDGSRFWARIVTGAIRDEDGTLIGFTKVTQDLTEQLELEKQRENLIAVATHELKTPLTSIKAYTQVLRRRILKTEDSDSAHLLGRIDAQISRLTKLVSDLLDVSKIQTGRLVYSKKSIHIGPIVKDIIQDLSHTTDKHKLEVSGAIEHTVYADEYRLGQVFTNIIENAIKHSPTASTIRIELEEKNNRATIRVADTGHGIRKEDQKRIFERFYRSEEGSHTTGFGLGLFVSNEIIKNHGGSISVKSKINKGSTFVVSLPLESK